MPARTRSIGATVAAAGSAAVVAAAAGVAYAVVETRRFVLREATVPVLAAGSEPLTILHLSDLHLTPNQRLKQDWVRDLATLSPDLVVDTGDNWAAQNTLGPLLSTLEPLLTRPGAFVFGSNDYFAPRPKNWARYLKSDARMPATGVSERLPSDALAVALESAGWKNLTNTRDTVVAAGRRIALVGVDDPHLDYDRFPAPDRSDGPRPAVDLHLGVTHAPYIRVLDAMRADGAELILAGHTHGGQLCVPGFGALVTNCDIDRRRASGLHGWPGPRPDREGGERSSWLNVSAGLGTSPYAPVRFACRPEATIMTLSQRT